MAVTVAHDWSPRAEAWLAREPSAFAGAPGRPLFIGACPRSGTTLLRVMLDNHPELAIPHETNFVRQLWWRRRSFGDLRDVANRRRVGEWIFMDSERRGGRLRAGQVTRKEAVRRVAAAGPTLGSIVETCFGIYADVHAKPRWGDKRPAYSGFIAMLLEMFPDAQYVNLVRDPRGAVASQLQMGWDVPAVAVAAATARWQGAIERTDHFARRLRPDQFLDVRYEDMVSAPHQVLERVCAFAGLPAGAQVLDDMVTGERRGRFGAVHERIAEPVSADSVERWRERLTPAQVALIEHATAPLLERFGYLPAAQVAPAADDLREHRRQRRLNRREWRVSQLGEVARRATYRRPVAAVQVDA